MFLYVVLSENVVEKYLDKNIYIE